MSTAKARSQQLFIVRMWLEPDAVAATSQWRGSVQHNLTKRHYYFTELAELLAFISTHTIDQPVYSVGGEEDDDTESMEL